METVSYVYHNLTNLESTLKRMTDNTVIISVILQNRPKDRYVQVNKHIIIMMFLKG